MDEQIIISFDGIKMKDFRAYWTAVAHNDWIEQDRFFARIVQSWPYPLDPNEVLSYGELEFIQYVSVQAAVRSASGELARKLGRYVSRV